MARRVQLVREMILFTERGAMTDHKLDGKQFSNREAREVARSPIRDAVRKFEIFVSRLLK